MDKNQLVEAFRKQLESDLEIAKEAAKATYEAATHEESKPENEYDTRGLEASYLAGAQAKRISEIEELLVVLKHLNLKNFGPDDKINLTALVEVESLGKRQIFFMLAKGGGLSIQFSGQKITTITPKTPLGEALQDLQEGDTASVENGDQVRDYEILRVW